MADIEFRFGIVPNRYQDVVQRIAVLYPLRGVSSDDEDVRLKTLALVDQWRARVGALTSVGWLSNTKSEHGIAYTRNCRPAFTTPHQMPRSCRWRAICPFCYARWVRGIWMRIDDDFEAPEVRSAGTDTRELRAITLGNNVVGQAPRRRNDFNFHLVERRHTFYRPVLPENNETNLTVEQNLAGLLANIEASRTQTVKLVDPVGAFLYATVEPANRGTAWKIQYRQLFKMLPTHEFPAEIANNTNGTVERHDRPSRRVVMLAVANACRYPTSLITGNPERTVQLQNVRMYTRFRGNAVFRSFRDGFNDTT